MRRTQNRALIEVLSEDLHANRQAPVRAATGNRDSGQSQHIERTGVTQSDLFSAAKDCIAATRREDGCISYELFESSSDPNRLVFVEQWQSAECLPLHSRSDHMKAFGRVAVGDACYERYRAYLKRTIDERFALLLAV